MGVCLRANGNKINEMGEDTNNTLMGIRIKENSRMEKHMAKENTSGVMAKFMMENGTMD